MGNLVFEPLYYADKISYVSENGKEFFKGKLNVINPYGTASIVTLWTEPWEVWNKLIKSNPELFNPENSPLVILTSLYGNGLPQMLANLANNPQIEFLGVTGNAGGSVPSDKYLFSFFENGVETKKGEELGKIVGTEYMIDPKLDKSLFEHIQTEKYKLSELESLASFVKQNPTRQPKETDRIPIELIEPVFSDFPSDITLHNIQATTPLEAWMELMYRLDRFGENIEAKKGTRRTLFNVDINVSNPEMEDHKKIRALGHDPEEFLEYQNEILDPDLQEGVSYTYGNRLRAYFGVDQLEIIIERLKQDPYDRKCLATTWDPEKDVKLDNDSSVPCMTGIYFVQHNGKLMASSEFRTHNSIAWIKNFYGLTAIQKYVSDGCKIEPGQINVRSRWISIDLKDTRIPGFLEKIEKLRKKPLNVNDSRGNFVIKVENGILIAEHLNPSGLTLKKYEGKNAKDIKNQLRKDSVLDDPDHAIYIGHELARMHQQLHGDLDEL